MNQYSRWRLGCGVALLFAAGLSACTPGYIKADDLESRQQGPAACAKSCSELHMRMVAMVLVGDQVPGCVCQVTDTVPPPGVTPSAPARGAHNDGGDMPFGAAASTGGYVVIAAAAARAQQQQQEIARQQQQQQRLMK